MTQPGESDCSWHADFDARMEVLEAVTPDDHESHSDWLWRLADQLRDQAAEARARGFSDLAEVLQHAGEFALIKAQIRDDVLEEER